MEARGSAEPLHSLLPAKEPSFIADINAEGGEGTVHLIQDSGGDAFFVKADVAKASEIEALIKQT